MKTTSILVIIVAIAVVAVFLLFGTNNTAEEKIWSESVTQITEEGENTTKVAEGRRVYGNISEIGEDHIIVDNLRLEVNERTRVYDNGAEITPDDLKEGATVAPYIRAHMSRSRLS